MVSGKVAPFTRHVSLGGGADRRAVQPFGVWGVIGELPMQPRFRLAGEVAGERTRGGPNNAARLAVIWQPMAAPVFPCTGVRHGISRGVRDWQFTAGVTVDVAPAAAPELVRR